PDEEQDGLTAYRLLAAGLAARAARGTPHHLPADPLVRDLYLVREAAAVDAHLARTLPGLRPALNTARADALAARPERDRLTPPEAAVEEHLRDVLAADLLDSDVSPSPEASRAWAEEEAGRIESGRYRGLPAVAHWGLVAEPPALPPRRSLQPGEDDDAPARVRIARIHRRPKVRQPLDGEDDDSMGI